MIVSVHSRDNAYTRLLKGTIASEVAGGGGIYYWQKDKAIWNLITSGVQFPGITNIPDGVVRSVSHPLSQVKSSLKDVTQTKQFKRWFGDSKIVNEDGTPKMRLRENAGGIGFFYGNKKESAIL